jgi:hypothetical protein
MEAILNYFVENADTVIISGISETLRPDVGNVTVRPAATATYTLTARNRVSEDIAVVTVVVERPLPRIIRFASNPATIIRGQKSTLSWETVGADSVEITNVGSFGPTGSTEVMPSRTQAYVLIARNRNGEATASTVVTVQVGPRPRIVEFAANPIQIVSGGSSTLRWLVENADEVMIEPGVGKVDASGTRSVSPTQTTTYTLTATNQFGSSSARATVEVLPRVRIISFTVTPEVIKAPGEPVTFRWETENAQYVFIDGGIGNRPANGSLTNAGPIRTQTYTLTAVGFLGTQDTRTVTVTLDPSVIQPPNRPPQVSIPQSHIVTAFRDLILQAVAVDPDGDQLTFAWRSVDGKADVLNPTVANPTVKLKENNFGDFTFEVTVTDPKGATARAQVRVTLVLARPVF